MGTMKEFLKNLRNEDNQSLIDKLNYNQQNYNKWYDIINKKLRI